MSELGNAWYQTPPSPERSNHIVVSNCDEVEFNQVAVVLFVTLFWVCVAVFVL